MWKLGLQDLKKILNNLIGKLNNVFCLPRIRSSSWARPRANTGIRHRPPRLTMSWTVPKRRPNKLFLES